MNACVWVALLTLAACTPTTPPRGGGASTAGQSAPPIPADDPHWARLNGLRPSPFDYGESSWSDVRMRVAQHVAVITRDRARSRAMRGDWTGCAEAYEASAQAIEAVGGDTPGAVEIRSVLVLAARRDAASCRAIAGGPAPPEAAGTIAPLRRRLAAGGDAALAADAERVAAPDFDPAGFQDFEARHRLRAHMIRAYADAVDPFAPTDPWGPWTPAEVTRQAAAIAAAARRGDRAPDAPSRAVAPTPVAWSVEEVGALPTGDTLVDTAGLAGPAAIGTLEVMGLDDPTHRAWLTALAERLGAAGTPDEIVTQLRDAADELERRPEGSRYYNVKQLRNAGVRQLARRGAWAQARAMLRSNLPLHAQDWACPNREGILGAIEGRLLLAAGDPGAEDALRRALDATEAFLAHVRRQEASGGPPPPAR